MKVRVTMDSGANHTVEYTDTSLSFDDKIRFSNPTDHVTAISGERIILSKVESFQPMEGLDND